MNKQQVFEVVAELSRLSRLPTEQFCLGGSAIMLFSDIKEEIRDLDVYLLPYDWHHFFDTVKIPTKKTIYGCSIQLLGQEVEFHLWFARDYCVVEKFYGFVKTSATLFNWSTHRPDVSKQVEVKTWSLPYLIHKKIDWNSEKDDKDLELIYEHMQKARA